MILLVVEGESDQKFFEYVRDRVLQQSSAPIKIADAKGIVRMLQKELPDAISLLQRDLYTKVIAVFDHDKMNEPYNKQSTRIERLRELLWEDPRVGGLPIRENLEDLIQDCLPNERRKEFKERINRQGKPTAIQWAIKQNLDQDKLRARLTDLQRSLYCQLIRDF